MPIYDLSYRHWEGALRGAGGRWWVIAEAGLRLLLTYKRFVFLLLLCWIPFFIQAFTVYLTLVRDVTMGFSIGPTFFQTAYNVQFFALVVVSMYAGSGLISNDLAANALPLYFAKPITRLDYVAGKFAIIALALAAVFLMPVLVLFLFAAGVAPSLEFLMQNWWLIFSIVGYGVLVIGVTSLFILALSSSTRSSRLVGVAFIAVVVFSNWLGTMLSVMLGNDQVLVVSYWHNFNRLSHLFFGGSTALRMHWLLPILALGGIVAFSVAVLSRRIRPVEIVS